MTNIHKNMSELNILDWLSIFKQKHIFKQSNTLFKEIKTYLDMSRKHEDKIEKDMPRKYKSKET